MFFYNVVLKESIFVASDVVPILYNNGGYIKYVGEGAGGFYKFCKKNSQHRRP